MSFLAASRMAKTIATILLPIIIALIGWRFTEQQHNIEMQKQYLDRVALLLGDLSSNDSKKRSLAIAYMKHLAVKGEIDTLLSNSLADISIKSVFDDTTYDPLTAQAVKENFGEVYKRVSETDSTIDTRIFIHIQSESQRDLARSLTDALKRKGWSVPSIVVVDRILLSRSQLRFFRKRERTEADSIKNYINSLEFGEIDIRLNDLSGFYENSTKLRPKTYEIWLKL